MKYYKVDFLGINHDSDSPELGGLDGAFSNAVSIILITVNSIVEI